MIPELEAALKSARALASDQLPLFLGELETVRAVAWSRLTTTQAPTTQQSRDELLDVDQAAGRLGISASYLYRNHQRFPFSRRVGRSLRFSALGIDSYIQDSGALTPRRRGIMLAPVLKQEGTKK